PDLERPVATGVLAGLVGAFLWVLLAGPQSSGLLFVIPVTPSMALALLIGVFVGALVGRAARGLRGRRIMLAAILGDAVALGFGHAYAHTVDGGSVLAFLSFLCAILGSGFALGRRKRRFELVVAEDGTLSWLRASKPRG